MYANGRRLRTIFMLKNTVITGICFLDMKYFFKYSCHRQEYPVYGSWRDSTLLTKIILDIYQGRR